MKKIIGHLVTEKDSAGNHKPLPGFRVGVREPGSLFDYKGRALAFFLSKADGLFELSVIPATFPVRQLEIVAYDKAGRELPFTASDAASPGYVLTDDRRARIEDHSQEAEHDYGQFVIREADAKGLKTTLGTGQALRYSEGNRVTMLMDRDAFSYAAAMIRFARQEVLMSQLFFASPRSSTAATSEEEPNLIFDFDHAPGPLDLSITFPRPVRADDQPAGARAPRHRPPQCGRAHPAARVHGAAVPQDRGRHRAVPLSRQKGHHQALDVSRRRPDGHRRAAGVLRGGERTEPGGRGVQAAGAQRRGAPRQDDDDGPRPHAQHRLAVRPELRRSPGPRHRRVDSRRRDRLPEARRRFRDGRPREGRFPRHDAAVLERRRRSRPAAAGADERPGSAGSPPGMCRSRSTSRRMANARFSSCAP